MKRNYLLAILFSLMHTYVAGQMSEDESKYFQGVSLLNNNDTSQAQSIFLKCVDIAVVKDSISFAEFESCYKLYEILYARKQYRLALDHLLYTKNKRRLFRPICQGGMGRFNALVAANKEALCYYYLNKKDSALSILTPLIFNTYSQSEYDTAELNGISSFYVKSLSEVYGECAAKKLLGNALKNIVYKQQAIDHPSMSASFHFLDFKIELDWEEFKNTTVYKLIMELNCNSDLVRCLGSYFHLTGASVLPEEGHL